MRWFAQTLWPPIRSPWLGLVLVLFLWAPHLDGQSAAEAKPKPESYQDLANDFLGKDDYDNCISNCLKAIHQNPRDARAYDIRALARGQKGDLDGAIADFRTALRISPTYANAYANCGWFFQYQMHNLRVALADYNEAIRLDPTNADNYICRAAIYLEQTNFDQALNDYNTAIQLQPNNANMFISRARAYSDQNEWGQALDDFNTAVQLNPTNAWFYIGRADLLYEMTNCTAATLDYEASVRLNPVDPLVWSSWGFFHERMTNYTSAIADFTHSIQLEPTNAFYYEERAHAEEKAAKIFAKLGDDKVQRDTANRALQDWQQAVTFNSTFLIGLGRFECRQGQFEQGIADFTHYLQTCPTNYGSLTSRAYAYEMLGHRLGKTGDVKGQEDALAKALTDWNQLVDLKSDEQASFVCLRGDFYARNHQFTNAQSDYHRAIELQPTSYQTLISLAWFLVTCPDPAFRDGTKAMAIARQVCTRFHYEYGAGLAVLAAAYAEISDFAQAIKWQQEALADMKSEYGYNNAFRAEMQDRLALYEKGQPCHQPLGLDVFSE